MQTIRIKRPLIQRYEQIQDSALERRFFVLKVRFQRTKRDIRWFNELLKNHKEVLVTEVSDIYDNKGTKKYFREYVEVEKIFQK